MIDIPFETASARHKQLYTIFKTCSQFANMTIKQEVSMRDLVAGYPHSSHRVDWFIKELGTCIELHGQQHDQVVRFGSMPDAIAKVKLAATRRRDDLKARALISSGYAYIEIWYDEELNEAVFIDKLMKALENKKKAVSSLLSPSESTKGAIKVNAEKDKHVLKSKFRSGSK